MEKIKLKDGSVRYRESYYYGNKKINGPCFKKVTDAKTWKSRVETERLSKLSQGEHYFEIQNVLFGDYANKWLDTYVKANCVFRTHQGYEGVLKAHLLPRFEKISLRDITEEQGLLLMNDLRRTHNPKGVLNIWQVMKAILLRARKEKLIPCDPFENIQRPKLDLRQDSFWIKDEITQFLRPNTQDQLYPFFFVAIHTGMRLAELCGLCWDRIDFRMNQISVTRTRDKTGIRDSTKTKLKRIIPMTGEVRAMLLATFAKKLNGKFVFVEKDGGEIKYAHVYRRFHQAQDRAEVANKIRFHDLRHSFASNYMMNGGNVFDLQKLLGHTKIDMTMRYAHFSPDHLQGSLRFMNMVEDEGKLSVANDFIPFSDHQEKNVLDNLRIITG
jgi:integrase